MTEAKKQIDNALVPFTKLNKGLAEMKKQYSKVPDVETKEGYEVVKANLKEYRSVKKRVEDTYKVAVEDINDTKAKLLGEKKRIIGIVEEVFAPHQKARKDEDERLADIKYEKAQAKEKRQREIKGRIDNMRESYAEAVSSTSDSIATIMETHERLELTEELYGDDLEIAKAVHSAMAGKLCDIFDSKLEQEELTKRLKKESDELDAKRAEQKIEDEKRDLEQREKQEAETKRMAEENAKLRADNEKMQAERKKLDDEKAEIEAEKQQLEDNKRIAKEKEEEAKQLEFDRLATIAREEKEAKEQADREAKEKIARQEAEVKDKKERAAAEKKAKKEAKQRREELHSVLYGHGCDPETLIRAIEAEEIPYLRVTWTEK